MIRLLIFSALIILLPASRLLAGGTKPTAPRKPVLAVMRLEAMGTTSKSVTDALDDFLQTQIFDTRAYDLVERDKIDQVMREFKIQKSGVCDTTKCFADIGGAMGADKLLFARLSKLDQKYIISLKIIDIALIKQEFIASEECVCSADDLTGKILEIVGRIPEVQEARAAAPGGRPGGAGVVFPGPGNDSGGSTRPDVPGGGGSSRSGDVRGKDGAPMVLVPAREFLMGSAGSDKDAGENEKPQHRAFLDAFYIDKLEVTVARYREFLGAFASEKHRWCWGPEPANHDHTPPAGIWDDGRWTAPDQPVVGVDWYDAYAYCAWAGKRLPTEAEWEKAARGTEGRIYPWGNDDGKWANGANAVGKTTAVGSYPKGASPYGALDMAGNVWEWVQDWFGANYYKTAPPRNPPGPSGGQYRVVRGGSWYNYPRNLRSANRGYFAPTHRDDNVGLRCAQDQ